MKVFARYIAGVGVVFFAWPAWSGASLDFPNGAVQSLREQTASSSYALPTAPFDGTTVPVEQLQGAVRREVWRIDGHQGGTAVLFSVLAGQLADQGFEERFSCQTQACGGFDFRFGIEVAPEPAMHVNLSDFQFLAAERNGSTGPEHVSLLVSVGGGSGFVQVIEVGPASNPPAQAIFSSRGGDPVESEAQTLLPGLIRDSRAPLPGVVFDTGSTQLSETDLPSLNELAAYLQENPDLQIVLVGHTDAQGVLDTNITMSRARAATVRSILVETYGIEASRIDAQGVGYLMPLAPNSTQAGRDANRRVEVVILNTE